MRLTPLVVVLAACKGAGTVNDSLPGEDDTVVEGDDSAVDDTEPPPDADGDGTPDAEDCAPEDAAIHPGAEEVCDTVDNDCDGAVDEDEAAPPTWHRDADGDGFGDDAEPVTACAPPEPEGWVNQGGDCDEAAATTFPGAPELCNDVDDDCDGAVPEGEHTDADADGLVACDDCDDADACATTPGSAHCPLETTAASCAEVLAADANAASGVYRLTFSDGATADALCDMSSAGGGWALVVVSSDDGTATWTYANHTLLTTDTASVGDVCDTTRDYKAAAYNRVAFSDLLFVHRPSESWARYDDVSDGTGDLGAFIGGLDFPICYGTQSSPAGYPMTDGTLAAGGRVCSTDLFFNTGDHEDPSRCTRIPSPAGNAGFGPTWSVRNNNGCPLDDPGTNASLGLSPHATNGTGDLSLVEFDARGWGLVSGYNTGAAGAAENRLEVWVR